MALLRDIRIETGSKRNPIQRRQYKDRIQYFVEKAAPSSGLKSLVGYDCGFEVESNGSRYKELSVTLPLSTVCPCSKEISDEGEHNQRANITIVTKQPLEDARIIWLEDLIGPAKRSGSAEVLTTLRRIDEKAPIKRMFKSPAFVEDVVRNVVQELKDEVGGVRYTVKCESFESIHPHNAYAESRGEC